MRKIIIALTLAFALLGPSAPAQNFSYIGGGSTQTQAGNPNVRVWVNTDSGVYHCPNTRWYGVTKQGTYLTQREAQEKGNRPAYGKLCQ